MKGLIHPCLSYALQQILRQRMYSRSFERGATLYQRGMAATGFYLVESGSVRVLLPIKNGVHLLETAGEGAILGLPETVPGTIYRTTVQADESTTAAFLARDDFLELLGKHPDLGIHVIRMLSNNLQS